MEQEEQLRSALIYAGAWGAASRSLAYRRIVELLVYGRGLADAELLTESLSALHRLQPDVPPRERLAAVALAAEQWPDARLLSVLARETEPAVENASCQPVAEVFGSPVLSLPASEAAVPAESVDQPRFLPPAGADRDAQVPDFAALTGDWRWECDAWGRLERLEGAAPAELSQRTLFDLESSDGIWQAFRCRMPFQRLPIRTNGLEWHLSGVPVFGGGQFLGYRGVAIRRGAGQGLLGALSSADSLADVAHEVRSPLNAIMGFAQMIQSETLGPVPEAHRHHAGTILDNAARLLGALDDVTDVARLDRGIWSVSRDSFAAGMLLDRVASRYRSTAISKGVRVAVSCPAHLSTVRGDQSSLDRALSRLLTEVLAACVPGEVLLLGAQEADDSLRFYLTMPDALAGMTEEQLFEASLARPEGGSLVAPLLGFGFGLRLVRQLAAAMAARFIIESQRFQLVLPLSVGEQVIANDERSA